MEMSKNKKVFAVLSGKGGTGKTLLSVNLSAVCEESVYIDCDVEEPNGHLFFKPININEEEITVKIPAVTAELCTGCRKCADLCNFSAIAIINKRPLIFEEVCHSCGACVLLCDTKALYEKDKAIGKVQSGTSDNVTVKTGILNTGEASGIPIIKKLLKDILKSNKITFIDCPPGSACIVMESIKDADYCILVAEPTIFGSHNLKMVYELVKLFNKPCGVVLNKCIDADNPSERFCNENNIKIIGKIPFDTELGTLNSDAEIASRKSEKYQEMFSSMLEKIIKETDA